MGHFGPFTYPNNLSRAMQQSWHWPDAKRVVPGHKGFIRLRSSYIFGGGPEIKCLPQDYAPYPELQFLTKVVRALMIHPSAIAYFNPGGEILMGRVELENSLAYAQNKSLAPLDIWTNVRLFNFNQDWLAMDTVGMGQLDLTDQEAFFLKSSYNPTQVANFLRNVCLYLLNNGEVIKDGHTMDGPGSCRWQARLFENGYCAPPRRVIRWLPLDSSLPPKPIVGE